ncbi:MAG: hypothetical protein GQ583_12925 [Methyloprofundus sp.]|nr:hypothetical protein [Methyloprofundus sp.]
MNTQTQVTLHDLTPFKQIPKKYPHLYSENSWKWAVANRQHNGLARAFRKVGKKLFVNELELAQCINEQVTK